MKRIVSLADYRTETEAPAKKERKLAEETKIAPPSQAKVGDVEVTGSFIQYLDAEDPNLEAGDISTTTGTQVVIQMGKQSQPDDKISSTISVPSVNRATIKNATVDGSLEQSLHVLGRPILTTGNIKVTPGENKAIQTATDPRINDKDKAAFEATKHTLHTLVAPPQTLSMFSSASSTATSSADVVQIAIDSRANPAVRAEFLSLFGLIPSVSPPVTLPITAPSTAAPQSLASTPSSTSSNTASISHLGAAPFSQ